MSWQLASFTILAAMLLAGFAWYERSRPSSQIVALVAALAALAVAGRVAFAALPNVVATTDIVFFAGFALGPAPGFAVGALGGLVSNFWFGQGPWTPWQMAGWGACGLLGALLARFRRRAGRLELAAACALAGVLYGALLNFSLMATYGGELSLERFLALSARAVPFDAAHAIGNAVIAFVAGPALVRMLTRFRDRFQWRRPALAALAVFALGAGSAALPQDAAAVDTDRAAQWLIAAQNNDGGWGSSPDRDSAPEMTAWALLGLAAAGHNAFDVSKAGRNPVSYLRANADGLRTPGDLARTILALHAAGADPRSAGGRDLVADLIRRRRGNGSYEGWPGTTSYAILALRAAGAHDQARASTSWLAKVQTREGGWGDVPGSQATADGTGAAMQAIPDTEAAGRGLAFLRGAQRPSGGFPLGGSGAVNAQSTAWAVQGISALGRNPASFASDGKSAVAYLSARQAGDGHFRYSPESDQTPVWVTGQVLAAVAGGALPFTAPPRKPRPSPSPSPAPSPGTSVTPSPPALPSVPSLPPASGGTGGIGGVPSVPPAGGTAPLPLPGELPPPATLPEAAAPLEPVPGAIAAPAFEASENPGPQPWVPAGIGLGTSGLALGGVLLLGRRFGW